MKPKSSRRGAFLGTAIFLGSLAMPAFAVEVAGDLLINLDPSDYVQGALNWNQHSATPQSIQGPFVKNANGTPQKTTVGGATAIVLDGDGDYFIGPNTTAALHGPGVPHSVEYWAFQGHAKPEEAVLSWSSRGGPDGTFAGFRYAAHPDYGAIARWGPPDMGYPGGPPEMGKWHLITVTYDGSPANGGTNSQKLYVDGVLRNSAVTSVPLDAKDNLSINIGGERENAGGITNQAFQFTGAIGKIRIHSGALTDAQVAANYNEEKAGYPGITPEPLPRAPLHRFSFSNPAGPAPAGSVIPDSIGGLTAKIVGDGATFTGTKVQLPGGAPDAKPAYVDLPNGLISTKARLSIEVWSTQTANQNWSRLFTFGSSNIGEITTAGNDPAFLGSNGLMVLSNFQSNPHYRLNRLGGTMTNGPDFRQFDNASSINNQLHQVIVYDQDRREWRMYRNGFLMESLPESQGPTTIRDVNNWLGRSDFGGDNGFAGTFDEFRVYNYMLTESQIRGNTLAGPDTLNVTSTFAQAGWLPTAGGTFSYNTAANWNPATVPNGPGVTANIVSNLVADQTVNLDTAVTVGALTLGDSDGSNRFTLAAGSGGSLTFDGGSGNPAAFTLNESSVGNTITAPLTLATDTEVAVLGGATGAPLTFSGSLSGPGDLIKGGLRTMTITSDLSAYAGDIVVSSGRLTLGNGGTTGNLGTGGVNVRQGASFVFNRSDATTITQNFTGAGSIIQEGAGEVTFDGSADTTFRFQIEPGTSVVNDGTIKVLYINVEGQLTMDQPDASVTVNDFNVGDLLAGPSRFLFSDGTVTANNVYVGKNAGTSGVIVQTGGTFIDNPGGDSRIGGFNAGASDVWGAWRVLGGTVQANSNFQIGAFGVGIMEVDGGTVNFNDGYPVVARFHDGTISASYGLLDIRSGSVNQTHRDRRLIVGEGGYGTLNVRGSGVLDLTGGLLVGGDPDGLGDGSVNLHSGGIIETRLVDQAAAGVATGTFNFHGGLLRAKENEVNFFTNVDQALIYAGGAKIDTDGFDVVAQQGFSDPTGDGVATIPVTDGGSGYLAPPFVEITGGGGTGATAIANIAGGVVTSITVTNPGTGYESAPTVNIRGGGAGSGLAVGTPTLAANTPGTFTKMGAGTLTLSGSSNYTGATHVEAGTLQINGYNADATGLITVDAGATLSGTGTIHNATIAGTLAPGAPTGTLYAQDLTLQPGAKFLARVDDAQPNEFGAVDVFNTLTITGAVLDANVVGTGTFPYVIATASQIVGDFASVAPGVEYTKTATQIILTKAGSPFQSYIGSYFPGEGDPAIVGPDADPDNDGTNNLTEFALNSDPASGAASGKVVSKIAPVDGAPTLVLTLPVRDGATFSGETAQESNAVDGVRYRIEGSDNLVQWNLAVAEVTGADKTAIETGLPELSEGWTYRTFRSPGGIAGDPMEFLRAAISMP